jgi:signal peptidase II
MQAISKQEKLRIALTVTGIAGTAWLIDAVTKHIAIERLSNLPLHGIPAIPNLLYFILGTNYGGSNGIPPQFMEFCLAVPAVLMFLSASWLGRRLRKGRPITLLQQVGLGLFLGGALANWSERVIHQGVTDFIFVQPVGFCIFNLADIFIDIGYTTLIVAFVVTSETLRRKIRREKISNFL